jgi:hypothetical protein
MMDGFVDLLLLLAAFTLVVRSNSERDEVWALCLRLLAVTAVFAVITNVRGIPISLLLLALALWLPSAARFETLPPPER